MKTNNTHRLFATHYRNRTLTCLTALLVSIVYMAAQAQTPAFLANGLVAYYPLNGDVKDYSKYANDGAPTSIVFSSSRFGVNKSAATFDGSQSFIEVKPSSSLVITTNCTLSAWVMDRSIAGKFSFIVGQEPNASGPKLKFQNNEHSQLQLVTSKGETMVGVTSNWIHYLGICNGTNVALYVNGTCVSSNHTLFSGIPWPAMASLFMGRLPYSYTGLGYMYWRGALNDVRIYNRALSASEVQALYAYDSVPHDLPPRQATATSQIANGFVVGGTITDGGVGYTNAPAVAFTGGGGTGATATSAINTNGNVTAITVLNPGHGYTNAPTVVIAPPPFPPRQATANVQLANGFIVGATLTDGGFGYSVPPRVRFIGGGGNLAAASSAIDSNGVVTGITVTNPGSGYNTNVQAVIDPPFIPNPTMTVAAINYGSLVTPIIQLDFGHLAPYNNYQIEFSPVAAGTWTNVGTYFIPTATTNTQFINATGKVGFFRVKYVP